MGRTAFLGLTPPWPLTRSRRRGASLPRGSAVRDLECSIARSTHRARRLRPFPFQSSDPWYRQAENAILDAPALSRCLIATERGIVVALPALSAAILLSSCSLAPCFP